MVRGSRTLSLLAAGAAVVTLSSQAGRGAQLAASDGARPLFTTHSQIGLFVQTEPGSGTTMDVTIPDPSGVAISPDGHIAYVTARGDDRLYAVRTSDHAILHATAVGSTPAGVAVAPDGARAYVANAADGTVSVVDTATGAVVADVPVGSLPYAVAAAPDGSRIYVSLEGADAIAAIEPLANGVEGLIPVGSQPRSLAISPDGRHLYSANRLSGTVSVVDTATAALAASIPVGASPEGLALTDDGAKLYVTHDEWGGTVSVIDTASAQVIGTIAEIGGHPRSVAVDGQAQRAYVAASSTSEVTVIDLQRDAVVERMLAASNPVAVQVQPAERSAAVLTLAADAADASTARLRAQLSSSDAPVAGRGVEFGFDGVVVGSVATGADGVAVITVSIADWPAGAVTATAAFAGDYTRTPAAASASLTIPAPPVPNTAPAAGPIAWAPSVEPIRLGTTTQATVSFTDPDTSDAHVATIAWGDGTSSEVAVKAGGRSATAAHAYSATGLYAAHATVTDSDGASGRSEFRYAVVSDPLAGYLTGGGSFASPAGSYTVKPSLAGTAYITQLHARHAADGTMKYRSNVFKFSYLGAGLSFSSYDMRWLVISGARAWLNGYGTVTISGVNQSAWFLLSVVDGAPDKVRVKIWTRSGVIYDTQRHADGTSAHDDAAAASPTSSFGTVTFRK